MSGFGSVVNMRNTLKNNKRPRKNLWDGKERYHLKHKLKPDPKLSPQEKAELDAWIQKHARRQKMGTIALIGLMVVCTIIAVIYGGEIF